VDRIGSNRLYMQQRWTHAAQAGKVPSQPLQAWLYSAAAGCTGGGVRPEEGDHPLCVHVLSCRGHMQRDRSPGKSLSSLLHVTVRPPRSSTKVERGGKKSESVCVCFAGCHMNPWRPDGDFEQAYAVVSIPWSSPRQGTADLQQRSWPVKT
jgi:hypothetical protein